MHLSLPWCNPRSPCRANLHVVCMAAALPASWLGWNSGALRGWGINHDSILSPLAVVGRKHSQPLHKLFVIPNKIPTLNCLELFRAIEENDDLAWTLMAWYLPPFLFFFMTGRWFLGINSPSHVGRAPFLSLYE